MLGFEGWIGCLGFEGWIGCLGFEGWIGEPFPALAGRWGFGPWPSGLGFGPWPSGLGFGPWPSRLGFRAFGCRSVRIGAGRPETRPRGDTL